MRAFCSHFVFLVLIGIEIDHAIITAIQQPRCTFIIQKQSTGQNCRSSCSPSSSSRLLLLRYRSSIAISRQIQQKRGALPATIGLNHTGRLRLISHANAYCITWKRLSQQSMVSHSCTNFYLLVYPHSI